MIAIQSKKPLFFPPNHKGIITVEITKISNRPKEEYYDITFRDTCYIVVQEQNKIIDENGEPQIVTKEVKRYLGNSQTRTKSYPYKKIKEMFKLSSADAELNEVDKFNEFFRQILLTLTQKECNDGNGIYLSKAKDWKRVEK